MDLRPKPRFPHEEPRRWPLGLEPDAIRATLMNLPVGKAETPEQLLAVSQWMRTRDFLLRVVEERAGES